MSFYNTQNIIWDHDVEFKNLKIDFFLSNIKTYTESDNWKVIKPTSDITHLFWNKINYISPASHGCVIRDNRLEILNVLPNLYHYQTFEEVIQHLQDPSKDYFLVKVTKSSVYGLYVVERTRLAKHRDEKIEQILHGIY